MPRNLAEEAVRGAVAEQAYGPIYSAQYADAMKSGQANEVARRLGIAPDIVEANYPDMLAEDRIQRATTIARQNPAYAGMMSRHRFAAAAIDDHAIPKVASATSQLRAAFEQRRRPHFADRVRRYGLAGASMMSLRDTIGAAGASVGAGLAGLAEMASENGSLLNIGPLALPERQALNTFTGVRRFYEGQQRQSQVQYENWWANQAARGFENIPTSVTALLAAAAGHPEAGVGMLSAISGGQYYGQARDEGLSPGQATLYAGEQAAFEAAGEALPIFRYVDDALRGSGLMKRVAGQLLTENVGEQLTGHLQDFNQWAQIEANQGKTFDDFMAERPGTALAIAVQTTAAVGAQTGIAYGVEKAVDRARKRSEDRSRLRFLDKLMDGAKESSARSATPSEFADALAEQLDGTAAENLHVPAEAIRTLFQTPEELSDDSFWGAYAEQVSEAEALGGDVVIPLSEAATHLAGTPQWEALKDQVRLSPGGSSRAEIAEWEADGDEASKATGEQMAAMLGEEADKAEPVQKIYEGMRDKLMLAGFTPDAASNMAVQFSQRQRTRAERLGQELTGTEADTIEIRTGGEPGEGGLQQGGREASADLNAGVELKPLELAGLPEVKDHQAARAAVRPGEAVNLSGERVEITGNSVRKWFSRNANAMKRSLAPHLVDAFERSVTYHQGEGFDYAIGHLKLDGRDIAVRFAIRTVDGGRLHQIEGVEVAPISAGPEALQGARGPARALHVADAVAVFNEMRPGDFPLFQTFNEGPRGQISFTTEGKSVISLFESRNLSTFIHETGHLYLEELKADAAATLEAGTDQARQLFGDWETVKAWFKREGHEIGEDGQIPTEAHELFARGFERFAMEGKAPSTALRRAFDAFRSWLLGIYKVVDNLRSPITPEIRDVMARLIATDEEIASATAEQEVKALFSSAAEAGMTPQEFAEYQTATREARDEAYDALLYRTMAPIRAARTAEHKERERNARAEVSAEIDDNPLFRALRLMRSGEDGKPAKLSTEWLVSAYGDDILAQLPPMVPPLHSKAGEDGDIIADRVGFKSGDEMVRMLLGYEDARQALRKAGDNRSPRQVQIDEQTQARMAERYGDPLADGSIEADARALIHNERQGEVIASEVRALGRRTGQRPTPYAIARRWARGRIQSGQVSEVISGSALQGYQRAARNAAKEAEAAMLKGDADEAFRQKQKQMLNNALIQEGQKAKDAVDAAVKRMSGTARRKTARSIDQDYLDQAHALLESVEFKPRSQRDIGRQLSFEAWAAGQRANGVDVVTPEGWAESIGNRHWSRLSVEEITGLDDTVRQILHLGRLKQTLLDGQERRARDEIIAEMGATAGGVGRRPPNAANDPSRSFTGGLKSRLLGADAALIKVEQLVDWLDGGNPNGVFNRMLFKPLAEAQGREADLMRDYVGQVNELVDAMPKRQLRDWRRRVDTPELVNRIEGHEAQGEPWQFYKDQVVMIALNMGNEGNKQRLLDGYGWSEAQVQSVLARLMSAEDWAFVQGVWDTIDGLWPDLQEMEKRVNGVAPDKVDAIPVETPHGTFSGGYFPAVYDPGLSSRTDEEQATSLLERGYIRANVTSSASKARATRVKRPILLSMNVITRHLSEVIHDITHREALTQTWRLVSDERVQRIVTNAMGREYTELLKPWLKHIANDQARNANSNSAVVNLFRKIAHNVTIVGLGFRVTSSFAQLAGIPSIVAQIGEARTAEGWARFLANPMSAYREVTGKSAEMRDRFSTMDRDIVERAQQQSKKGIRGIAGPNWFVKYAYHGILIMDSLLTTAGWIGAYRKSLSDGMSEEEAIYYADKVVRKSQGAGGAKDQAAITREHAAVKPFVMFFSYFSALYNQQRDFAHMLRRVSGAKDAGRALHYGFWAMIMPPLLDAIIRGQGPGDDDDDETAGGWLAQKVVFGNLASIPGVRDIGGAIDRDFGYKVTPIQNIGESLVQGWKNMERLIDADPDTDPSEKWLKQTLTMLGLAFGKPTGQIATSAQFGYDVAEGEQTPEGAGDWWEGLTTGKVEQEAQ